LHFGGLLFCDFGAAFDSWDELGDPSQTRRPSGLRDITSMAVHPSSKVARRPSGVRKYAEDAAMGRTFLSAPAGPVFGRGVK